MEHIELSLGILVIIGIVLISKKMQKNFKLPLPHSFLILAFIIHQLAAGLLPVHEAETFDKSLFFAIPILLAPDALHLKWKDIKRFWPSMVYLAVFSVAISIIIGAYLSYFNILVGMTIGMYVALFAINMATDAISVSNIFSQFNVPHNVKILTEGESLFNDATAMVAFFFIGLPWVTTGVSPNLALVPVIALKVFAFSGLIGAIIGYVGYVLMKSFDDIKEETLIIIAVAYLSFVVSEFLHVSGIFALIVGLILFKTLIDKDLAIEAKNKQESATESKKIRINRRLATTKATHEASLLSIDNYSYMAVVFIFVSLAGIINVDNLFKYWKDILIVFTATTIIRAIVMAKFVLIGKKVKAIDYVGFSGWVILTLAGMKGALSLIMVHALPATFIYKERFESITIGVILLSIFVYGISLLFYMIYSNKNQEI